MLLPEVLDGLAEFGVHDRATLFVFARKLREAGLMSATKRGRGAAPLSAEDVASLTMAALATASPSKAVESLQLIRQASRKRTELHPSSRLPHLNAVLAAASFGEAFDLIMRTGHALEREMEAYTEDRLAELKPPPELLGSLRERLLDLELSVMGPRRRYCALKVSEVVSLSEMDGQPLIEFSTPHAASYRNLWIGGMGSEDVRSLRSWTFGSLMHKSDILHIAKLASEAEA